MSTRYQGSKLRLLPFLRSALAPLRFGSVVDVFAGTCAVSYLFKQLGKQVHVNDALRSSAATGVALIENGNVRLPLERIAELVQRAEGQPYRRVIETVYDGVFYLPEENRWLDVVAQNLQRMPDRFERALAQHALFQACMMKRPFNLFHRKNLSVRLAQVERSFGNKTTWERPFEQLFRACLEEANAAVFDAGPRHTVSCADAFECSLEADLVYLDPPYVRTDKQSFGYADGYHFLEGLAAYDRWEAHIDRSRKHLPFRERPSSPFEHPATVQEALFELLRRVPSASILALSYRDDGLPSIQAIAEQLRAAGRRVEVHKQPARYALSKRATADVLVIGSPRRLVRSGSKTRSGAHGPPAQERRRARLREAIASATDHAAARS